MGCQTSVVLDNDLTFSICTHDPDTGILTDADSDPLYAIYEDNNPSYLLNGTMTKLGSTGFYVAKITCSTINGFEVGKSYTAHITATVDSDTGGICYGFTVTTDHVAAIMASVIEGSITIQQALALMLAVLTGKSSGGGTTTITFRDTADTKDRIVATVDGSGNRTAVSTRDGS